MAEALLEVLVEKVISLIQQEVGLIMGVDKEMKKLSSTLTTIQKVLEDAEDKQFHSKQIQNWLSKLNDIAYEIEDVLDECATEVSKLKHKATGKKLNYLKKVLYNYKIGRRMKEVAEKLDAVAAERHNFHLNQTVVVQQSRQVDWRRETGSVLNEPDHIFGRDEDKEEIIDLLVNQVTDRQQLSVLPIIGVGGLGKTTLAQFVFNDDRVTQHFHTKLWVCVSDDFDLKTLLKEMIEFATKTATDLVQFAALELRLREVLSNKKYLLVLDDVWTDNQEDWAKLRSILACGSKGCSIVVTTRLKKVADIMGTLPSHCLKGLSEEDCWLLFKLRAFGLEENEHHHPKLEAIGRQIVMKCAGVPLAAKALGGLLRFKREEKEWIHVNESEIWNIPEEVNSILPVLRLSYHHLPFVLKRCFSYCAVFRKDYIIEKQDLIFRWMAHGCISSDGRHDVEDVGDHVWNELVLRSFFQQVEITRAKTTFKMHDLVHDLAQSIMENKSPGAQSKSSSLSSSTSRIREVHWSRKYSNTHSSSIAVEVSTLTTIMNYGRLRILKLYEAEIEELPSSIGKMKHLRCLDLSYSSIQTLPHTFCGLWNLQILNLDGCRHLKSLPTNMRYMTNLRHIFLEGCDSLSYTPVGIGELTSLKTLSMFIVGDKIGNQFDELEYLNLGGRLEIKHLERVQNHMNAKKANLVEKPKLRDLVLRWEDDGTFSDLGKHEKVLDALEPHPNLETLKIYGFKGSKFPVWVTNLNEITIEDCPNILHLTPLGYLPCLGSLKLRNLGNMEYIVEDGVGVQNSVGAKIFPSLKILELAYLPNLKGLSKEEVTFPNLETLDIESCPLLMLPPLPTLESLTVIQCSLLNVSSLSNKLENLSYLRLYFGETNTNPTTNHISEDALEGLCNLKWLRLECAREHRLPERWFQCLKSVRELQLWWCKIGSCFPEGWWRHLSVLEDVYIDGCSELGEDIFKDLHLLKKVTIDNVSEMVSLPQGLQHSSSSLQSLRLSRLPQLTSLPDWLGNLTSLTQLDIWNCPKVPSLPSSIQGITNLQSLGLSRLPQLTSLPDWLAKLTSLTQLEIWDCPNVASLPSSIQGITNLHSLEIYECPLLESRCEKEKGQDWHKIAHIPDINIIG